LTRSGNPESVVTSMRSILAYEREPYRQLLETEICSAGTEGDRPFVVLADTILYPEGGGQPADRGWISGVDVEDVRTVDEQIRHYLAGPPPVGQVEVRLDWLRRFDHMQQHTGQHLLTAMAEQRFGWHTTAFHLGERLSDVELDMQNVTPDHLTELEDAIAAEIRAARPVRARRVRSDEYERLPVRTRGLPDGFTGDIRLVEIDGIDLNTCGGTHVGSTAEIEALKLLGHDAMRGGTRLFYVAGVRLRRLLGAHHERNASLRQLVGAADEDLPAGVSTKLDQLKDAQRSLRHLEEELALAVAQALAAGPTRVLAAHWPARDLPFLQRVAREVARLAPDRVAFLTSGEGDQGAFVLSAGEGVAIDLPVAGKHVAEILGGRGGGSGRLFQGKAAQVARRKEALAHLTSLI
jgi:Ser-tRNA(Ala) deacylase AlaX